MLLENSSSPPQVLKGNDLEENFSPEELLNENPKKYFEMMIKIKDLKVPKNIEEKIT